MQSRVADMLDIELPIFAFSHCRDVVAAVSRSGGMGVLGTSTFWPEQLEIELRWLDENSGGQPYGVDVLLPAKYEGDDLEELRRQIPQKHWDFLDQLRERFGIPEPKDPEHSLHANLARATHKRSREMLDIAYEHKVGLIASGLGPPPPDIVEQAHSEGAVVAGLVGDVRHVEKHVNSDVDIIVAVGTEGGGHTGRISTMVLVPQVVDAAAPRPVLAAGGIGTGRQVAAGIALGAEGVWTGSVWLTTHESDLDPIVVDKLLRARSSDTVQSRWASGKTVRQIRTPWVDAWDSEEAPDPLPTPLQAILIRDAVVAGYEARIPEIMGTACGQIVGTMNARVSAQDVLYEMAQGFIESTERLANFAGLNVVR